MATQPYMSFVVAARNDNYGGDFLDRVNRFVNSVGVLSERYALPCELVIVEWNPPPDRPRLRDAISWPGGRREFCRIRIVEVSRDLHEKLPNPEDLPLFEYIGKNAGIRRCEGQFILATNPDIIFSQQIMRSFATQQFSQGCFYRAARNDIRGSIPSRVSLEEQLEFCRSRVAVCNRYIFPRTNRLSCWLNPYLWLRQSASYVKQSLRFFPFRCPFMYASGDFLLMHRQHWTSLRGYAEFPHRGYHLDSVMVLNALLDGCRQIVLPNSQAIYHQEHARSTKGYPYAEDVRSAFESLLRRRRAILFNSESWGLASETLTEQTI